MKHFFKNLKKRLSIQSDKRQAAIHSALSTRRKKSSKKSPWILSSALVSILAQELARAEKAQATALSDTQAQALAHDVIRSHIDKPAFIHAAQTELTFRTT